MFLAGVQSAFGDGWRISQSGGCLSGAATIALTGYLGRAVAGRTIGLLGALLVAFSPAAIAVDGSLMSETLYVPIVLLALLIAYRARQRPTVMTWCALGAVIGLAALTRADGVLLVLVVMIPTAVLTRDRPRHLLPRVALGCAMFVLVLSPWVLRNAIEVGEPSIETVSSSGALAAANCPATYYGAVIGYWKFSCREPQLMRTMSEADYAVRERRARL